MTLSGKDVMVNLIIRLTEVELTTGSIRIDEPTVWAEETRSVGFILQKCRSRQIRVQKNKSQKGDETMELLSLEKELKENSYPGRGIVIGRSQDGTKAVTAYFIMGRSENSRNRVFVEEGQGIRTQAFDPSKLTDPSLIIYAPVRVLGNRTIVTNGDQTDTIYEGMDQELTFEQSLRCREFEPDAPNYTPRISGVMHIENGNYDFAMSILKTCMASTMI